MHTVISLSSAGGFQQARRHLFQAGCRRLVLGVMCNLRGCAALCLRTQADLVRYKQCQLQQMAQQASLLLHQLEKNKDGYVDPSRLLLLFPSARAVLAKSSPVGLARSASGTHLDIPCPAVRWLGAFDVSQPSCSSYVVLRTSNELLLLPA